MSHADVLIDDTLVNSNLIYKYRNKNQVLVS